MLNNKTNLMLIYTPKRSKMLETVVDIQYKFNSLSAFVMESKEFVSLGATQRTFSACMSSNSIDEAIEQYEESGDVTCSASESDCLETTNALADQVTAITASVGATAGSTGCFAGSCIVALLLYVLLVSFISTLLTSSFLPLNSFIFH